MTVAGVDLTNDHAAYYQTYYVCQVVENSMAPFPAGRISLWREHNPMTSDIKIVVEVEGLKQRYEVGINDVLRLDTEHNILEHIARSLYQQIYFRPAIPVDDHIVLGEE